MNPWAEPLTRRRHYTTAPRTWVPGELVTAGMMNTIRDSLIEIESGQAAIKGTTANPFGVPGVLNVGGQVNAATLSVAGPASLAGTVTCGSVISTNYQGWGFHSIAPGVTSRSLYLANDGGRTFLGIEDSTATTFGVTPYSSVMYTDNAQGINLMCVNGTGYIRFWTGGTEKMRLHASGGLALNGTIDPGAGNIRMYGANPTITLNSADGNAFYSIAFHAAGRPVWTMFVGSLSNGTFHFLNMDSASYVSYLMQNGAWYAAAYNLSSDRRLKRNIQPFDDVSALRLLAVKKFEWIKDGTVSRGIIAQDAHSIVPHAVTEGTNEISTVTGEYEQAWGVDYSKLVPDLIVGWQNHEARIAALEEKLGRTS